MKNLISRTLPATAVCLLALLSASANAQTAVLRINVPFAFQVNNMVMPAGEYRVETSAGMHSIAIRSAAGDIRASVPAFLADRPAQVSTNPALVFNRYGDQYFLRQVCPGFEGQGLSVSRSKTEREVARFGAPRQVAFVRP